MSQKYKFLFSFEGKLKRRAFFFGMFPILLVVCLTGIFSAAYIISPPWDLGFIGILHFYAFLPLLLSVFAFLLGIFLPEQLGSRGSQYLTAIVPFLIAAALCAIAGYISVILIIKRLNDLNLSPWFCAIMLIPYVNGLFLLFLFFKNSARL